MGITVTLFAALEALDDDKGSRENYVRSVFGYPGGKSKSLDQILPHLPYRKGYIEAFGGSGAVWLARNESDLEVFNDRYSGIVSFYRVMRDPIHCQRLIERLALTVHSREEFLWCRDTWRDCQDDVERAARWYYSIQTSFARQGRNFGRSTNGKAQMGSAIYSKLPLFHNVHMRIRNSQIENLDWRLCLKDYDNKDHVFYLDPPYWKVWKGMYECEMADDDHIELLERIFHMRGFVAISSYDNDLYRNYPWDFSFKWEQRQTIQGLAFHESNHMAHLERQVKRQLATEVLYVKEASN
jgi:DNA adenine methylase